MNKYRNAFIIMTLDAILVSVAAHYVIREQEKKIEKANGVIQDLVNAVNTFIEYAPPEVVLATTEKIEFNQIVRFYND